MSQLGLLNLLYRVSIESLYSAHFMESGTLCTLTLPSKVVRYLYCMMCAYASLSHSGSETSSRYNYVIRSACCDRDISSGPCPVTPGTLPGSFRICLCICILGRWFMICVIWSLCYLSLLLSGYRMLCGVSRGGLLLVFLSILCDSWPVLSLSPLCWV